MAFYAEKAHLTTRHFSVIIKEVVGISASDYIEQYLATQAKNLLSTRPNLSVQQISDHLGYADSPSFCRFFKRHTGTTPMDYRKLIGDEHFGGAGAAGTAGTAYAQHAGADKRRQLRARH